MLIVIQTYISQSSCSLKSVTESVCSMACDDSSVVCTMVTKLRYHIML